MPELLASWNPTLDVWEGTQTNLFSGHSDVYSATLPTSGMTRAGQLFALPISGRRTGGNESSLLPTPTVGDHGGPEARSGKGFNPPLGEIVRGLC